MEEPQEINDNPSIASEGSSPTSNAEFILVDDNISTSSSTTKLSFSDAQSDDFLPKLGHSEHSQDVSQLVAEAQIDLTDYYATDKDQPKDKEVFLSRKEMVSRSDSPMSSDEDKTTDDSKDACIMFHGLTYLGSTKIDTPMSELQLKKSISILRDHTEGCIDIILSVSVNPAGTISLIDPESRTDIATYEIKNICFWGKGKSDSIEKDCLAFNIGQGKEDITYQCHVFKCNEDDVKRILHSIAQTIKKDQKRKQIESGRGSKIDGKLDGNLNFKFNIILDIWEEDGKGSYQTVARDKTHFKLRKDLQRKLVFIIEQTSNYSLKIERCFGLLLAQGRDISEGDFHLLQQLESDPQIEGKTIIHAHWDSTLDFWKVLNTDPGKDNKVYMTVAADVIFEDLKEPVRFVKEAKVRVFPANEKFWNPAKPCIQEEFVMQLKENIDEKGDKWFEKESLQSASEIQKLRTSSGGNSISSIWKSSSTRSKARLESEISVDPEIISGPEEEDDEPLLSGSGAFERSYSDGEMDNWKDILEKWKDTRPSKLTQAVRRGIPNAYRGTIWHKLSGNEKDSGILDSYSLLLNKDSSQEQVILWDVTRTFPAHEHFREANGPGQNGLYNISKMCSGRVVGRHERLKLIKVQAYSNYDEEVGYCQGLSFMIATFLLHMSEEDAYCILVKLMYHYGLRDLFRDGFADLHQYFFVLDRILEETMNDLYQHFQSTNIESHMYASQWFLTLFTAKFPLSLVFNIIDIILCEGLDAVFQVAAAFLKTAKKDLLQLDFEGILKYFRINMPKYYMLENHRKELVKTVYEIKISKKRVLKYKQEYSIMKEEQELKEDPIERLKRENKQLQRDKLRLERENDTLAYEVVTTQVSMQEVITDREEKLNENIKETEQLKSRLTDAEEDLERLKEEDVKIKDMWRESMTSADVEKAKRDRIIDDYKQILARLEERNEKLKKEFASETELLKKQLSTCENCTTALLKNIYPDEDGNGDDKKPLITKLLSKEDHEEQMRSLEEELIKTKVALAEEKNRADEIEMKLHNVVSANDKPWYKKVTVKR